MPCELSYERHPGFIHAIVTGDNTNDNVLQYMKDIQDECTKQDCYRVLIEEKFEAPGWTRWTYSR